MNKSISETRIETKLILKRIMESKEGEVIPYSELSELIGCDVQNGARRYLDTARKQAETEQVFCDIIRGVGVKRITQSEFVNGVLVHNSNTKIRRENRRCFRRTTHLDYDSLSKADKETVDVIRSRSSVVDKVTSKSATEKLTIAVRREKHELTNAKALLELFGS